jgi:hypothetical protein
MKYYFFLLVSMMMFIAPELIGAQTPDWLWAMQSGGPPMGAAFARSICVDKNGDMYVLVNYNDTIQFGDSIFYSASQLSVFGGGSYGMLLVKYTSERKILWIRNPQGIVTWRDGTIALDSEGNCYIAAQAATVMDFGNNVKVDFGDSLNLSKGTFVVKYDPDGIAIWVIKAVPLEHDFEIDAIATDRSNNFFITGGIYKVDSAGTLLAKYNSGGQLQWLTKPLMTKHKQNPGGDANVEPWGLSVTSEAENQVMYISGEMYSDTVFFGNNFISGIGVSLPSYQPFLAKMNAQGECEWIRSVDLHQQFFAEGNSYSVCANDQYAYVCGNFSIDSTRTNDSSSGNFGNTYSFIAQYDRSGSMQWIRSLFSQTRVSPHFWDISCNDVSVDSDNNSYLSGIFIGATEFGDTLIFSPGIGYSGQNNQFPQDVFAAKFDKNGNRKWVQLSARSSQGSVPYASHQALYGDNLYVAGGFIESVDFGATHLIRNDSDTNEPTFFLAKLSTPASSVRPNQNAVDNSLAVFPNPASAQASLNFTLAKPDIVSLEIFDLLGRRMKQVALGEMSTGEHSQEIDLHGLSDGSYLCKLQAGGEATAVMFTILK